VGGGYTLVVHGEENGADGCTQMACEPSKLDNFCGGGGDNWILITVLPPVLLNGSVPYLLSSDIQRYETANNKQFQIGYKI